ncbi:MAG TPA: hypothetical protein VN285_00075 [Candidatus Deferrimicrobium sp.]|nr:hypothetical protein [Candidatus Deferrimicrobium sp.]
MKTRTCLIITLAWVAVLAANAAGETEFFRKFKADYAALDMDLLNNPAEAADIREFVYRKDLATFTFHEGQFHLLRHIDGRPTTAIFVGRGNARIDVPSRLERQALAGVTRDSVVDEDFEVAFIRMADDFDLQLREKFSFAPTQLSWKTFTIAKQAQGEQFFKPIILHTYDNYFQLLRSHYERRADGYFWIDFNRYVFSFDPNRPEQVAIDYELGMSDMAATASVSLQRQEIGVYDDYRLSDITFPTTIVEKSGTLVAGGMDGFAIDSAAVTIRVALNRDSLRFLSLFLPAVLNEDSIYLNGRPVEFYRRKDFNFIGIIMPEYRQRGDTLLFTLYYHGKNFDWCLPYVENPQVCPHNLTFVVPKGYNYYVPGMSALEPLDGKRNRFTVSSTNQYRQFYFHAYPSGIDTIPRQTQAGITLNFLKAGHLSKRLMDCFINEELFQSSITGAFDQLTTYLGLPPNTFVEYIVPERLESMPGVIMVPQTSCATEGVMEVVGGFDIDAGVGVARQWFGSLMRPASDREVWIGEALPHYLALLYVQGTRGAAYQTNLVRRRDSIYTDVERKWKMPLAAGSRAKAAMRINKGVWLVHMLRFLMYDLDTKSEARFLQFLQDLAIRCNSGTFTNEDFIRLAEKSYGQSLEAFFRQWLYGRNFPEFNVEYKIDQAADGYFIDVNVAMKGVDAAFTAPVAMHVTEEGGHATYTRQTIAGPQSQFRLGPFADKPKQFVFNEFYSVLSKDDVKKK